MCNQKSIVWIWAKSTDILLVQLLLCMSVIVSPHATKHKVIWSMPQPWTLTPYCQGLQKPFYFFAVTGKGSCRVLIKCGLQLHKTLYSTVLLVRKLKPSSIRWYDDHLPSRTLRWVCFPLNSHEQNIVVFIWKIGEAVEPGGRWRHE